MKFNSQRNKLEELFNKINNQDISLNNKNNIYNPVHINPDVIKAGKIIYDTGWLNTLPLIGNVIPSPQIFTNDEFVQGFTSASSPTQEKNQLVPNDFDLFVTKDINIQERFLPFLKPVLMIKTPPENKVQSFNIFAPQDLKNNRFYDIDGDGELLYKGLNPQKRLFGQHEIDNGELQVDHTGKWFRCDIDWTSNGGDNFVMTNALITFTKEWVDLGVVAGTMGAYHQSDTFSSIAWDTMSASAMSGEGIKEEFRVTVNVPDPPGPLDVTAITTTTKNFDFSTSLFGGGSTFISLSGSVFKNGSFDGFRSLDNPISEIFLGSLSGKFGGPAQTTGGTLNSFSVTPATVFDSETETFVQAFRLFWDEDRAREFRFNTGLNELQSTPNIIDYETATLPYTQMRVQINPTPHPEIDGYDDDPSFKRPEEQWSWLEVVPNEAYRITFLGTSLFLSPASKLGQKNVPFGDETYTGGSNSYSKDGDNQPGKDVDQYTSEDINIQFRFMLGIVNPSNWENIDKRDIIERDQ